jgi:8-oxo-dGTP diphosphatase
MSPYSAHGGKSSSSRDDIARMPHSRLAVKALIPRRDDEALLVRRTPFSGSANPLKYGTPGGAVEQGETLIEGLRREVAEETALEVAVEGILGIREWNSVRHGAHYVCVFFACRLVNNNPAVSLNHEHCEYIWATSAHLPNLDLMDSQREIVQEYLNVRSHVILPYKMPLQK